MDMKKERHAAFCMLLTEAIIEEQSVCERNCRNALWIGPILME